MGNFLEHLEDFEKKTMSMEEEKTKIATKISELQSFRIPPILSTKLDVYKRRLDEARVDEDQAEVERLGSELPKIRQDIEATEGEKRKGEKEVLRLKGSIEEIEIEEHRLAAETLSNAKKEAIEEWHRRLTEALDFVESAIRTLQAFNAKTGAGSDLGVGHFFKINSGTAFEIKERLKKFIPIG